MEENKDETVLGQIKARKLHSGALTFILETASSACIMRVAFVGCPSHTCGKEGASIDEIGRAGTGNGLNLSKLFELSCSAQEICHIKKGLVSTGKNRFWHNGAPG